ncbi:MAG: shikimate kinase [Lachnospiraceae bacterium]|nr:shikimate kinase [Lachnospiraceae bacterium]
MMEDNVVLIGMPGSGKSTIGVVLAKVLGYRFIDSDLVIQESEKRLLKDIIEEDGLEEFIRIEERVNASLEAENSVIATGGSVIYGPDAMRHLRNIGTVIYLKLSYDSVKERLGDLAERGVVLRPDQDLYALYEERCPLYEKYAHITVNCEDMTIEQSVKQIVNQLEKCIF